MQRAGFVRLAVLGSVAAALAAAAPPAVADGAFSPRFAANETGGIVMAANTLLSCEVGASGCPEARAGAAGAKVGNNQWEMAFVDVDIDSLTFNSSRADLVLPADASILFAGLYWGANTTRGTRGFPARGPDLKNRVRFATPSSGGYVTVIADRVDERTGPSQVGAYQAFGNVTELVRAGGAGSYTVADVQTGTGVGRYAGWSLVVAYHSRGAPLRNLTVFDGFATVDARDPPHEVSVSGFRTPAIGTVRSTVGIVGYEGDRSSGGDRASLNETQSQDNLFDSSIRRFGQPVTSKTPDYDNQLGFDADVLDTTGVLGNGVTSATVKLETTGDSYLPGVAWSAIDVSTPDVQSSKSVTDLNGGLTEPGDELEYVITGTNRGEDRALNAVVTDPVPAGTSLVPGSLRVTEGAGAGSRSDAAGDDAAEFDGSAGQVVFRVGTGAGTLAGGRIAPNETYEVRYRVRVAAGTPSGTVITNRARVSFLAETLGVAVEQSTTDTRLTTAAPDLAMNKSFGIVAPGTYGLTVTNVGDARSRGPVVVTDAPPAGIVTVVDPGGFTCTGGATLRCERSGSLAPGESWVVTALISVALVANSAVVDGGGDVNGSNNTDTILRPQPSLAIEKHVTPDTVAPGDQVTYLLTVGNRSSATAAEAVQVTDLLPPGLTLESVEALDQGSCVAGVSCSLGTIPAFNSARVRIRARVGDQVPPGAVTNTAAVSGPLDDAVQGDNADTGTFVVRRTARLETSKRLTDVPRAGQEVGWTVTVRNTGPHDSPGGDFVDALPEVVEDGSAAVPGGSCTVAGRIISCALPPIAVGNQVQISITGRLPSDAAAEPLLNGVQVAPDVFKRPDTVPAPGPSGPIGPLPLPPAGGSSTPQGDVIRPAADVGVAKVATPDPLARDGRATWHVRTTNHGPSKATRLKIRDTLPVGARFVRATGAGRCSARKRAVTCRLRRLRAGRSVATRIVARLHAGRQAGRLRNSIVADAEQPDPAAANNRDRASSPLAPRLKLRKVVNARTAELGDTLRYTLRLRNGGPGAARNVVLCDRPGPGLMLRRASGGRVRRGMACWTIRRMARGSTVHRRFLASVTSTTRARVRNVATVRFDGVRVARASRVVRIGLGFRPEVTG
jgi:uncharacterized repeat protein (TIGR01451 family)